MALTPDKQCLYIPLGVPARAPWWWIDAKTLAIVANIADTDLHGRDSCASQTTKVVIRRGAPISSRVVVAGTRVCSCALLNQTTSMGKMMADCHPPSYFLPDPGSAFAMLLGEHARRSHISHSRLQFVLPAADDIALALHHRVEASLATSAGSSFACRLPVSSISARSKLLSVAPGIRPRDRHAVSCTSLRSANEKELRPCAAGRPPGTPNKAGDGAGDENAADRGCACRAPPSG